MKKLLSAALALAMALSLMTIGAGAAPTLEELAHQDLETASPEQREAILNAREKIIYGGQSWTVNGALSLVDLETGTVTPLPEFSELFPGWDLPLDKAGEPIQKDEITREEQGVNAYLYLNTESGFGPVSQYATFWGSGKTVTVTPSTGPRESRCNLGVYSVTQQSTLGWAFGLPEKGVALQVNTQAGVNYSLRGNVFTEDGRGFRHVSVKGAQRTEAEPTPTDGYLDQRTVSFPAGRTWRDGKLVAGLPLLDQDIYIHVSAGEGAVPYHLALTNASSVYAWYPNLVPGQTGAVIHTASRVPYNLLASAAQAADMELVISSKPTPGITYVKANPFTDIPQDADYLGAVIHTYAEGLLFGTAPDTFSPDAQFTRAMLWAVLARLENTDLPSDTPWYAPAQEWVMASGISDGTDPARPVSLQEAVAMMHRQMGSPAPTQPVNVNAYGPVSDWAVGPMSWALSTNFLYGIIDHSAPTASITRADLAVLLFRYVTTIK